MATPSMKQIALALCALYIPTATMGSNPYVITDSRVQNLDVTPVLGRGYSIMTNSFQSTCLMVPEITIPSFNYDCKYIYFTILISIIISIIQLHFNLQLQQLFLTNYFISISSYLLSYLHLHSHSHSHSQTHFMISLDQPT